MEHTGPLRRKESKWKKMDEVKQEGEKRSHHVKRSKKEEGNDDRE